MRTNNLKYLIAVAGIALATVFSASAQDVSIKRGMDRSRLNIGAYHLQPYASTEAHVKDVADCGVDFMLCIRTDYKLLDLFQKYNVGAVLNKVVPGWWGGDGSNAGKMKTKNPLTAYDRSARRFKDHPAVWGIDIGDEPSALDFPHYGEVYEHAQKLFPDKMIYLNLYPNYASVAENNAEQTKSQLGTKTYQEYIDEYCKYVPADYLCYDYYLYAVSVPRAYENLRIVSDACRRTNRSMWIVLQVNSNKENVWTSENELRFQAYTAMAFGAENIIWACYTEGWWHNQVVDKNGNKTEQYDKLKRVNAEIHRLGEPYMKYRNVSTAFVGFDGTEWLKNVNQKSVRGFNGGAFSGVSAVGDQPLVVGHMVKRDGSRGEALFICLADDPYDEDTKTQTIVFRTNGKKVKAIGNKGNVKLKWNKKGFYTMKMKSNDGVLIETIE